MESQDNPKGNTMTMTEARELNTEHTEWTTFPYDAPERPDYEWHTDALHTVHVQPAGLHNA